MRLRGGAAGVLPRDRHAARPRLCRTGTDEKSRFATKMHFHLRGSRVPFSLHESRILGHSSNAVCAFSMMEQVRLFAVWPTENWLGYSLNQIQGWPTVRESYSRALKQRPLRGSQQVYSGFHPLVSNVLLLLFAKVARACLGSRQLQYQPTSWWKFQLVEASAAHLACYSISSVTFCLLTRY